jgi:hypothetical protein
MISFWHRLIKLNINQEILPPSDDLLLVIGKPPKNFEVGHWGLRVKCVPDNWALDNWAPSQFGQLDADNLAPPDNWAPN